MPAEPAEKYSSLEDLMPKGVSEKTVKEYIKLYVRILVNSAAKNCCYCQREKSL